MIEATYYGRLDIIEFLVANGADIHAQEDKALIDAVFGGYLDIIKFLLANGADIHAQNDKLIKCLGEEKMRRMLNSIQTEP